MYLRLATVFVVFAILEGAARTGWFDPLTLVPPSEVGIRIVELVISGEIRRHLVSTGSAVLISFLLAALFGVPAGWLLWRLPQLHGSLGAVLSSYYAVPIFAFYPVLVTVLGFNLAPIIAIAWLWAVVGVLVNTTIGLMNIPTVLMDVAASLRLTSRQRLFRVLLPGALPRILTGLKLGAVYSLIGVVVSEFMLSTQGLGHMVWFNYDNFRSHDMYAYILAISVLAILINSTLSRIEQATTARS